MTCPDCLQKSNVSSREVVSRKGYSPWSCIDLKAGLDYRDERSFLDCPQKLLDDSKVNPSWKELRGSDEP